MAAQSNGSSRSPNIFPFFKLEGPDVEEGKVSISDLQDFLAGIDKATKYYISTDYPDISKDSYTLEVKVEPGSVIVYLVSLTGAGAIIAATTFSIAYAKKTAEQLAVNDVGDKTSKEVLGTAMNKMKSVTKITKHLGELGKRHSFPEAKVLDKDTVILPNADGEEIRVTKAELETYSRTPRDTFRKMTGIINENTSLSLYSPGDIIEPERAVLILGTEKQYFGSNGQDDDSVVFPEWQHGELLTLRGTLCRANTNTGTLGFAYGGHILTSYLYNMEIQNIKESLFDKEVEVEVSIIRTQQKMDAEDELKRPKLEIRKIKTIGELDSKERSLSLFEQ